MLSLFFVLALTCNALFAQETNLNLYGYMSVIVPTHKTDNDSMRFRWAYLGIEARRGVLGAEIKFDVESRKLGYYFGKVDRQIFGGKTSFLYGKFLAPYPYLYPGPKTLALYRYPEALNEYSLDGVGLGWWYERGKFVLRSATFAGRSTAAVTYYGFSLFWEEFIGHGAIVELPWTTRFFHPFLGLSRYDRAEDRWVGFVQNYIELRKDFRLYGHVDYGDIDTEFQLGFAYEFEKDSRVKLFWDSIENRFFLELTAAF